MNQINILWVNKWERECLIRFCTSNYKNAIIACCFFFFLLYPRMIICNNFCFFFNYSIYNKLEEANSSSLLYTSLFLFFLSIYTHTNPLFSLSLFIINNKLSYRYSYRPSLLLHLLLHISSEATTTTTNSNGEIFKRAWSSVDTWMERCFR